MKLINSPSTIALAFLLLVSSCFNLGSKDTSNDDRKSVESETTKAIKEVILVDNGPVLPTPQVRRMVLTLKNWEDILLSYAEENSNNMSKDITLNDSTREEVRDEIMKVAEFAEDGMDVKQGKLPCVGMNSMDVAVVYNTGDTSHFAVSGSARCDPSLYPSVWALDSLATETYKTYKSKL